MRRAIDTMHLGREHVICAFEVGGLIVDPGPASCLDTLLEGLDEEPRALLLTHIHLDHAGAAGVLARAYPRLTVYVHERGAPHLADPSRLLRSARMLYGDQMDTLWGEVAPIDPERIQALSGGETVEGMRVAATPGHASHHVCYLREQTGEAFVGDMAGIRMPGSDYTVPPTPPPDIDVEAWLASVDLIERWDASELCLTHFGAFDDVNLQLDRVRSALRSRAEEARELSAEEFARWSEAETRAAADEATAAALLQAAPPDQLGLGLRRYWTLRSSPDRRSGSPPRLGAA